MAGYAVLMALIMVITIPIGTPPGHYLAYIGLNGVPLEFIIGSSLLFFLAGRG